MQWSELDLENKVWTIPAEKAKNGLAHRVPLSDSAIAVIRALDGKRKTFVLDGARGRRQKYQAADKCGIDNFTPHDLRRTAASMMGSGRVARLIISKVLNHKDKGVTAIYDRYGYDQEKREALT